MNSQSSTKKRKSSDNNINKNNNNNSNNGAPKTSKRRVEHSPKELEEQGQWGVSTSLKLYENPWKIKKTLTESDLGILSRLLLATDLVESYVLPMLGDDQSREAETEEGTQVRIWDVDTKSMHQLVLKRWFSSRSYVFIGKWCQDFVRRRELKKGDVIGLYWDPYNRIFNFCVLERAITKH